MMDMDMATDHLIDRHIHYNYIYYDQIIRKPLLLQIILLYCITSFDKLLNFSTVELNDQIMFDYLFYLYLLPKNILNL